MSKQGTIAGLLIRPHAGGPIQHVEAIDLNPEDGVVGDHTPSSVRQVTILSEEAWQAATAEVGATNLDWSERRANILVRGIDLPATLQQPLTIGGCQVQVKGETKPCSVMDEAAAGLKDALKPDLRGGVYAAVVSGGTVRIGDTIASA
ncbi:MAG: MOSC domain-containing protein [Planctomycetota bacterium]